MYHQFNSSEYHHFLVCEPEFPLRQMNINRGQRTKTCWFDSFLFFLSREIHGHFFHPFIEDVFNLENKPENCTELKPKGRKYYNKLVDYLCSNQTTTLSGTRQEKLMVKKFMVCQLLKEDFEDKWSNGHALYEPFRVTMQMLDNWSNQNIWFTSRYQAPHPSGGVWDWPLINTAETALTDMKLADLREFVKNEQLGVKARTKKELVEQITEAIKRKGVMQSVFSQYRTTPLDVEYLTKVGCLESVPHTQYIALNILRKFNQTGLTLDDCILTPVNLVFDTTYYELITMFPWDAAHVTCISKTRQGTWEGYDNEKERDVVGTLEQIAATNDDLNIAKRNVFAIYKRTKRTGIQRSSRESKEAHQ